jgi:hypothetical protein
MLASYSQIDSFPETHFFEKGFSGRESSGAKRVLTSVLRGYYLRAVLSRWEPEMSRLGYEVPNLGRPGHGWSRGAVVNDFVRVLDSLALSNGKSVWVEKTPGHVLRIGPISRYVGKAKFVHIVRDGRPVVASLYDVSRRFPDRWGRRSVGECISLWNACIEGMSACLGEPDHLVVGYERLLGDPEKYLRRLCSFVGVRYELFVASGYVDATGRIFVEGEDWKDRSRGPLEDEGLARYLAVFDEAERREIEERLNWQEYYRVVGTIG